MFVRNTVYSLGWRRTVTNAYIFSFSPNLYYFANTFHREIFLFLHHLSTDMVNHHHTTIYFRSCVPPFTPSKATSSISTSLVSPVISSTVLSCCVWCHIWGWIFPLSYLKKHNGPWGQCSNWEAKINFKTLTSRSRCLDVIQYGSFHINIF